MSKDSSRYAFTQTYQHSLDLTISERFLTILLIQLKLRIKVWSKGENKFLEGMIHQAQLSNSTRIRQMLDLY